MVAIVGSIRNECIFLSERKELKCISVIGRVLRRDLCVCTACRYVLGLLKTKDTRRPEVGPILLTVFLQGYLAHKNPLPPRTSIGP